eukprot:7655584-Alexandrium_andersonii.AAC.1
MSWRGQGRGAAVGCWNSPGASSASGASPESFGYLQRAPRTSGELRRAPQSSKSSGEFQKAPESSGRTPESRGTLTHTHTRAHIHTCAPAQVSHSFHLRNAFLPALDPCVGALTHSCL